MMKPEIKQRITQLNNGQVPDGYKKTEFGVFPCDWVTNKTFGDLFTFNGGLGKSREELSEKGIEYLHYGDMHRADFNVASIEQYSKMPKYDVELKGDESYLMQDGDVAFLDASEDLEGTSRAVLIDNPENKPFIAGLHIIYGKSKGNELSKYYKQYIARPKYVKKQFQKLASGFKVYGLNRSTIAKIQYAYPADTKEQEKVAEILMKWDEAIEMQEKYIEKLEIKRKSLIQRIFPTDKSSKKIKLGEYLSQCTERNKNGINNVKSVSNARGFINQKDQFSKEVASEDLSNYKIVRKRNIAYNPSRINVGSIAIYEDEEPGIVSPMYVVFSCSKIVPKFLLLLLETCRGKYEIKSYLSGSVRDSLSFEDLCEIELSLPTFEQEKIVNTFELIESEILENDRLLQKLMQQRKALQQYLLNGIVRVNDGQ